MKASLQWLRQWVRVDAGAEEVAERFTSAGLEVDSIQRAAPALDGVVVGEIIECQPHPDADRLRVCQVADGGEALRTVVCGAPNARVGLKAPLALPGAVLPGGLTIRSARLRGVESSGMLCSEPELGLGEDAEGLMSLPADAPTGAALSDYLALDDRILEFDLTPNRADCFSIRGLARELAALTGTELTPPAIGRVGAENDRRVPIELLDAGDCPRYVGRVVEGIDPRATTPAWLAEALRRAGQRSLSPVVDVTNYVLLELGQPMHAFDLDRLDGGIRVRRASAGERIVLLDGREVEPDEDMLLICDHARPVALAGIMGGQDSAVDESTTDILLESAWFNPAVIAGRARRLGLATESSHRFERGVDPELQALAVERATALIIEICGGRPGPVIDVISEEHRPVNQPVKLRTARVNQVLGTEFSADQVGELLVRLHMSVALEGDDFVVTAPSARRDIAIEADLIEEVARVYGYDRLPSRAPGGRLKIRMPSEGEVPERLIKRQLSVRGFQEVIGWSFIAEQDLDRFGLASGAQPLANPLSRDLAVLRTSLLPGLVSVAAANLRRQQRRLRLFETGTCFHAGNDAAAFGESSRLALLLGGPAAPEHFDDSDRPVDFFDLKGEIEHLAGLNGLGRELEFVSGSRRWLHPGQAAELKIDGQSCGWLGQLHPGLAAGLDLDRALFVAELDLAGLSRRSVPAHHGQGRFPSVRRDLALIVDDRHACAELVGVIREKSGRLLENCVVFDQYRGEGIEKGYRSLAIGLILRDLSRTLKDEEVDRLMADIVADLKSKFDAKLRGQGDVSDQG